LNKEGQAGGATAIMKTLTDEVLLDKIFEIILFEAPDHKKPGTFFGCFCTHIQNAIGPSI